MFGCRFCEEHRSSVQALVEHFGEAHYDHEEIQKVLETQDRWALLNLVLDKGA